MKALSFFALFLSGCGLEFGFPARPVTQSDTTTFQDGYYVATSDVSLRHYPLIVIKVLLSEIRVYQLSKIGKTDFGSGSKSPLSARVLGTAITVGTDHEYIGTLRVGSDGLRLVSRKFKKEDEKDPAFPEVGEILSGQDYILKEVSKAFFLETLRTLQNLPSGTAFSVLDEENCEAAFEVNCSKTYFAPL